MRVFLGHAVLFSPIIALLWLAGPADIGTAAAGLLILAYYLLKAVWTTIGVYFIIALLAAGFLREALKD